jgi:hypothetical protein
MAVHFWRQYGLIGWQLIGYPGPQMGYRTEIDKHYGDRFPANCVSR